MLPHAHWAAAAAVLVSLLAAEAHAEPFELEDGDRVAFVGNTLIERSQEYGYLELALTTRWPGRHIVFRNYGWSGDNVFGESRRYYGSYQGNDQEQQGLDRLLENLDEFRPTVIFVGYGSLGAFDGKAGLSRFLEGYGLLLDELEKLAERIVLVTPIRHEALGPPYPDPTERNQNLEIYSHAISELAGSRSHGLVNLFHALDEYSGPGHRLTDNSLHLTKHGYYHAALAVESALVLNPSARNTVIELDEPAQAEDYDVLAASDDEVRLAVKRDLLPLPHPERAGRPEAALGGALSVAGLPAGRWRLGAKGTTIAEHSAGEWAAGVALPAGPDARQAEELRRVIREKNRFFFHSYRPQNDTYLRGFRKHEQGKNAAELERFVPLIREQEDKIRELRVPQRHEYVLTRIGESSE